MKVISTLMLPLAAAVLICAPAPGASEFRGLPARPCTLQWDGNGGTAEPGVYTFELSISQPLSEWPPLTDSTTYRSEYLDIIRAEDEQGQPIFDAEYYDYDDKGTEDTADDDYIFIIRHYCLQDELGIDASEGELWFYDPDISRIASWDVSGLQCTVHNCADGLVAGASAIHHALLVPVPVALMNEKGGTYRFVLHVKDDHAYGYRNHQKRWALDLNAAKTKPQAHLYDYEGVQADVKALPYLNHVLWQNGKRLDAYAAQALGAAPNATVFQHMTKDSVWYCCTHGDAGWITMANNSVVSAEAGSQPPADVLARHTMSKCRLAVFHSCNSALTDQKHSWGNLLDTAVSIGAQCALGFKEAILYAPPDRHTLYLWLSPGWSSCLFEALCWGKNLDHNARNVAESASHAADAIRNDCENWFYHAYDSQDFRGNSSIKIVPAR